MHSLGGDGEDQSADELAELSSMASAVIFIREEGEPKGTERPGGVIWANS
jgi:hypothetical protein